MKPLILLLTSLSLIIVGCKEKKKYHDAVQKEISYVDTSLAIADIISFQNGLNEEFKNPETSPLPDRYRKDFETLDFFPADTSYVVEARFVRTPDAVPFLMPTSFYNRS